MSNASVDRFWVKVDVRDPTACWPWLGGKGTNGYGRFRWHGRMRPAHLVAFEIATKEPIPDGLQVCHHCDNPGCVNVAHLFLGTGSDNLLDCSAKGRHGTDTHDPEWLRGERNGRSKLSETCVRELRILSASGVNLSSLARLLGVDASTVARAVNGDSWAALGDEAGENDAASGPIGAGETPVSAADASSGGRPRIQAATPAPSPAEPPRWTSVSWSDLQRLAEIAAQGGIAEADCRAAHGGSASSASLVAHKIAARAVERWRQERTKEAP